MFKNLNVFPCFDKVLISNHFHLLFYVHVICAWLPLKLLVCPCLQNYFVLGWKSSDLLHNCCLHLSLQLLSYIFSNHQSFQTMSNIYLANVVFLVISSFPISYFGDLHDASLSMHDSFMTIALFSFTIIGS